MSYPGIRPQIQLAVTGPHDGGAWPLVVARAIQTLWVITSIGSTSEKIEAAKVLHQIASDTNLIEAFEHIKVAPRAGGEEA